MVLPDDKPCIYVVNLIYRPHAPPVFYIYFFLKKKKKKMNKIAVEQLMLTTMI